MSELSSFGNINFGGERYPMTRENTTVYNHMGKLALFDHVFVTLEESKGTYIWKHHPDYESLAKLAVENSCILHLNLQEVSSVDMKSYMRHATADLSDTMPEDWQ